MPYATLEEMQDGWRELGEHEIVRADVMLRRASTWLDMQTKGRYADRELSDTERDFLSDVTCSLVMRAWNETDPVSYEPEWSQMTTPYSQEYIPANKVGSFYLERWEKSALGISGGIGTVEMC